MSRKVGKFGEDLALDFFVNKGYQLLDKNYQKKFGEIDLIVKDSENIVFVEVKTRTKKDYGWGEQTVNFVKQKKIKMTIESFLQENKIDKLSPRFDVLVIEVFELIPKFIHYKNLIINE